MATGCLCFGAVRDMEANDQGDSDVQAMQVFRTGTAPRLKARDIYSTSVFNLFSKERPQKLKFEVSISWNDAGAQLSQFPLFTGRQITKMKKDPKYKYMHLGCFKIIVLPFMGGGSNVSLRVGLFDTKHGNLPDAVAGCYTGNLGRMHYKDIYPNVSMSVDDAKFWNVVVSISGLDMKMGSIPCSVTVEGVYCLTKTESHPALKGSNARRLSTISIPLIEAPKGEVVS